MTTLFDTLFQAEGAQHIRDCWGDLPQFKHVEILYLKHTISAGMADVSVLAFFATYESDDFNECKPSKMGIQFLDVSHLEFIGACGHHPAHGVELDAVFTSEPPTGVLAIDTRDGWFIACRRVQVVSCVHDPLNKISDGTEVT